MRFLAGVRPMLQDIAATDWLLTAPHLTISPRMARLGFAPDALVTERHLPVLALLLPPILT